MSATCAKPNRREKTMTRGEREKMEARNFICKIFLSKFDRLLDQIDYLYLSYLLNVYKLQLFFKSL